MGKELLREVSNLTGLSDEVIYNELSSILISKGIDLDSVTIEDLRSAMAAYVREIISDCIDEEQRESL